MQKRQFITMLSGAMLTGVSGPVRAQGPGLGPGEAVLQALPLAEGRLQLVAHLL